MQEFIKMPFWINGWEDINSNSLNGFKDIIAEQEGDKIDLKYLRNYYLKNQELFVDVVDELSLRGFEFYNLKPNNLLNKNRYENGEFIIADSNSKFINIDYETFYIGGFLSRFKVESNEFFNYVPLEGFKVLNPQINIEELKNELIRNGFKCYKYPLENKNDNIDKSTLVEETDSYTMEMINVKVNFEDDHLEDIDDIDDDLYDLDCMDDENLEMEESFGDDTLSEGSILKYFGESTYSTALKFLTEKGIKSISEITNETLIDYCKSKGAGITKIKNFKLKLIEIYQEQRGIVPINYNIFDIDFCFCTVNLEDARLFLKEEIKINDISEITNEDLEILYEQKGITNRKIELVREKLDELNKIERMDVVKRKINILFEGYWYEQFKKFKVNEVATILDINFEIDIDLTLEEVNGECLIELGLFNYKDKLLEIVKVINNTKSIKEIFENAVNSINRERELQILEYRYAEGKTLAEAGNILDLTRERIRQIQKKAENKITEDLLNNNLHGSLKLTYKGRDFCTLKDLSSYLPKGKEYYINILLGNSDTFSLFKPLNLIYFKNYEGIEERFKELIIELPETFLVYDYIDYLIDALSILGLDNPSLEEIEELLINYNYKIYGEYSSRGRLTLFTTLDEIFKRYIVEPLRIDESGMDIIIDLVKKHFNLEYDTTVRAIEARVRDNRNIILVDKTTFIHIDKYEFDKDCVIKAGNTLKEVFKTEDIINIGFVFDNNKDEFIAGGIKNKLALYSLIQYYYGDIFKVGKGNTLDIYRDLDSDITKTEDQLIEIISRNGGSISKEEIIRDLGWKESRVENTISISNRIIRCGKNITTIDEFNVSEDEKKEILIILQKLMGNDGCSSTTLLLNEMRFNTKLGPFINRNNITGYEILASVIKKLFVNIKGHSNFIYNEDSKFKNIDDIVRSKFKNIFFIDEVRKFIYSYGYKDMTVGNTIKSAIGDGLFIEISVDELAHVESFNISEDVISETTKFISKEFGDKEYLSLSDLKGYRRSLPSIDYKWNPYLIKSILIRNGFRSIERVYNDSRFEKVIVVKADSKIKSYADLIYDVISNEYKGNMHETKIYDFLADNGLVLKQEYIFGKKIPYDLKVTERIKIDEVGRVELL